MLQQQQQQRQQQQRSKQPKQQQSKLHLPKIVKTQRFKLLQDVTEQPYRIGVVQYFPEAATNIGQNESGTDNEASDYEDPGREFVERNRYERMKRVADNTRDELDKVLKRVDNTMQTYEYAVRSSLLQQGMTREEMSDPQKLNDVQELETILGDNLAKQRYKQRLMVFIFDRSEKAVEKSKLLNQLCQFFSEQKLSFSGTEFASFDDKGDDEDEIEIMLKAFDSKECYANAKSMGGRLNELNEEIIQFLVQNTGTKQTKVMVERGKRKLAQLAKETKEKISEMQSKLDQANQDILTKDAKIETLEQDLEITRNELKSTEETLKKVQEELKKREGEAKYFKRRNIEYEDIFNRYKNQLGDVSALFSGASQSETEDGDDATRFSLDPIDEAESKNDKESTSSHTAREQVPATVAPGTNIESAPAAAAPTKLAPAAAQVNTPADSTRRGKKSVGRRRSAQRSKKEANNQPAAEDPGEVYRRSQQLLESLLASQNEDTPDMNSLFKATRGVDLNNVTIDNLPTAFTNLRKFAILRVKDLLKDLETKEATNKETVQVLKQEFIEHKTTYEKERILYFLGLNPDDKSLQDEQNELQEKAENAHKLQMKAQKAAEEALSHLEIFMVEQEKLDHEDENRQTDLIHRHSVVVNNMTGANIAPPEGTANPPDGTSAEQVSQSPKRPSPPKTPSQKVSSSNASPTKKDTGEETKTTLYDTAQTLKRINSAVRKTPTPKQQTVESNEQASPPTPQKSSREQTAAQRQLERSNPASRRLSMAIHDDIFPFSKAATPQPLERTPSMHSRPLTRSNSINPANKEQEKQSSGERSYFNSAAQSRRVSMGLNRSPVRAEELERLLTKVVNDEVEALEEFRQTSMKSRTSLREKYMSLLEEKKHELDDLKQQADDTLSRPSTSHRERKTLESSDNSAGDHNQGVAFSPLESSSAGNDLQRIKEQYRRTIVTRHQEQQTSPIQSVSSTPRQQPAAATPTNIVESDQFKVPFFHLYDTIFKFRHSIINLLEQNSFISLADRLDMIKKLSSSDQTVTDDFVDNSEKVLRDTVKVLQTSMATLITANRQYEDKQQTQIVSEPTAPITSASPRQPAENPEQIAIIHQKQSIIDDLEKKYEQINQSFDENNKKHNAEIAQNERLITEQQRLIQSLQRELMRLQKRLTKVEIQGIVQPSIMFTRLDAERNEKVLQQAADKGKIPETIVNELSQEMNEYVRLPGQQFSNLVKRYIQHRKATQLEDRIQSETFDNEAKSVMEKMGSYYERRSGQLSERISSIRQHRAILAQSLTEKLDTIEHESSIFLIRPIFSYQGRAAAQSYMMNEKRRQSSLLKGGKSRKSSDPSRQSNSTQEQPTQNSSREMARISSSASTSDDEERMFQLEKSFVLPRPTPASQQSTQNLDAGAGTSLTSDQRSNAPIITEMSRLQEFDIQRTLMPISHASVPLSSSVNEHDSIASSLHLRSYVPLNRPGATGAVSTSKSTSEMNPVSREGLSALSTNSRITNPRTPFNSTVGDLRKSTPPLPPIKRSVNSSSSPTIDEKQADEFIPSISTNDFAQSDLTDKDDPNEKSPTK